MEKLFIRLWENHGERFIFMFLAICFAAVMYKLDWKEEAKVIIIGLAMLCYNKSGGTVGGSVGWIVKPPEKEAREDENV